MKFNSLHIVVTSFAIVAGLAIVAYQMFAPQFAGQRTVTAVEAPDAQGRDQSAVNEMEKSDVVPALATEVEELGHDAGISAALKDGSEKRYRFTDLFDGRANTYLTIKNPDRELNILVSFKNGTAHPVTAIEYTPPAGADPGTLATTLDVIVLPEGQLEASGRPVMSFTLQQSLESQTFAIPGRAKGKGLWLRVAGASASDRSIVGDFRILSEQLAP